MCSSKTVIVFRPYSRQNICADGELSEKAKELLIVMSPEELFENRIEVCQKSLLIELVSRCRKEFPKYGWALVIDENNVLNKRGYLKSCFLKELN